MEMHIISLGLSFYEVSIAGAEEFAIDGLSQGPCTLHSKRFI